MFTTFHPSSAFGGSAERRLLGFAPLPGPEAARPPETKAEIKQVLEKLGPLSPEVAAEMAKVRIDEAGKTDEQLREDYRKGLKAAGEIYFKNLKDASLSSADALVRLNADFRDAGARIQFAPDGENKVKVSEGRVGPAAAEGGERKLTAEQEKKIEEALTEMSDLADAAKEVVAAFETPGAREQGIKAMEALGKLSPEAQKVILNNGGKILRGYFPPNIAPAMRAELTTFRNTLGNKGCEVIANVLDKASGVAEAEAGPEDDKLSPIELEQIAKKGEALMKDFKQETATEDQKALKFAELRMAGVDVSDEEKVLNKGLSVQQRFAPPEGGKFARLINKVVGMITWVCVQFRGAKGEVNKALGIKPAEEAAGGAEAAPLNPDQKKRRDDLKKEMVDKTKTSDQLLTDKKNELKTANTNVATHTGTVAGLEAQQKANPDQPPPAGLAGAREALQTAQQKQQKLQAEVKELEAMKQETAQALQKVTQQLQGLETLLKMDKVKDVGGAGDLATALQKVECRIQEPGLKLQLCEKGGGVLALNDATLKPILNAAFEKLHLQPQQVLSFAADNEFQNPDQFAQVLAKLSESFTKEANKPPEAPAAAR